MKLEVHTGARRRPTLVEVAHRAGVSHQTVSRFLQQRGGLKPATAIRVARAIEELDYHPDLVARAMRTRTTGRLAIVVPSSSTFTPTRLLGAASTAAHREGFVVETISFEGDSVSRADRVRELADSRRVDGILSLAPLAAVSAEGSAAVVVLPTYDDDVHGLGELANGATVREIVGYLASLGHRRFMHIAGPSAWPSARGRRRVYLESIAALGLESAGVYQGDWSAQSGYLAVSELRAEDPPTAIVAANDLVAIGAIRAALDRGWGVPTDLSVFGWDDDEGLAYASPSLSTVHVDREFQGREAMLRLIALVRNEPPPDVAHGPLNRLVIRESTGAP